MRRAASRRSARWGRRRLQRAHFGWPLALALGSSLAGPAFAQNLPQGGTVTGGSGTIQQIDANLLQIQQNSQNLAIDWQSFNVGPSGIVRFLQPSSSAIALNRVIGNDPSAIYGQIQANGQVILLNPKGIYFGPNSMVDVNALVATTANIRNDDFMAGRLHFEQGSSDPNARVVNEGLVSVAQGGFAILAAAGVQNTGRIVANGGSVVLAGTRTFTVDFHGDGLLSFAATGTVDQAPSGASALVDNSGIIEATGGRVLMTARAARDVLDNVINTTGIVVARSAQMVNGEIVIDGGDNGIVNVNGLVDASGRNAGETGGTIKVLGEKVGLFQNARLDAGGDAGGGTVLVGGNYQGQGAEPNAKMVYMDAAAMIDASAVTAGNGGKVILWADETTRFDGRITARGGALSGNGGFVETSGKIVLRVGQDGMADVGAANGAAGTWLLDPNDIAIVAGGGASTNISGSPNFISTDDSAQIYASTINSALTTSNVTVTTMSVGANTQFGDITVSGGITNSGSAFSLTLAAARNISIVGGGSITGTSAFNITLDAASGAVAIGGGGIDTYGGTLTINAGNGLTQTAALASTTGNFPLVLNLSGAAAQDLTNAGNNFNSITFTKVGSAALSLTTSVSPDLQTSSLSGGSFTLNGIGFGQTGAITSTGGSAVTINGSAGNVTLSSANSFSGAVTVTGQTIDVTATQTATGSGPFAFDATRGVTITSNISAVGNISIWGNAPSGVPSNTSSVGTTIGVDIKNPVGAGVTISSTAGSISISGSGGDTGTYNANHGVVIDGASLLANAGGITMKGRGGANATGERQVGVFINGDTTLFGNPNSIGTTLSAGIGGLNIEGAGGTTGPTGSNVGLWIARAELSSTGAMTLVGDGGAGPYSHSIEIAGASVIKTGNGLIDVRGRSILGTGTGVHLRNSYDGAATSVLIGGASFAGNLSIETDSISNTASSLTLSRVSGGGSVWFLPNTSATAVTFNGTGTGMELAPSILSALTGFAEIKAGYIFGTGALSVAAPYAAASNTNLILNAGGTLTVANALSASGTGSITLESAKNVSIGGNVTTTGGDILIKGNVASWTGPYTTNLPTFGSTSGTFAGVSIGNGVDINAAGGSIAIAGKGGDTGANQYGIAVVSSASNPTTITTTGSGTITMVGQGGLSATYTGPQFGLGGSHAGIRLEGATSPDYVDISSQNGSIKLVGTGGGATASDNNDGVDMFNVRTRATGTGSIDITGVAGLGASRGIVAIFTDTHIATVSGDITMTGTGGGNYLIDSAFTGNAKGIELSGATIKSTGSGDILLNGIEGAAGPGLLINTAFGTTVLGAATMTGDLTIKTDSLTYSGTNTITHQNGTGTIAFETDTNGISIGVNGGSGLLNVTAAILGDITNFGTVRIGSAAQAGDIQIDSTTFSQSLTVWTQGTGYSNALTLGANNLTIIADGGYTQGVGAISTSGTVILGGSGDVTANSATNAIGNLVVSKTGSAANVSIVNSGALVLGASTMGTGTLSVTSVGLSQTGSLVQDAGGGTVTLDAGAGAMTLSQSNVFTGGLTATAGSITVSAAQSFARASAQTVSLTSNAGSILVQGGLSKINTGGLVVSIDAFETAWFDNAGITSNGGNITIWGNAPGGSNSAGALAGTAWGVRMDGASALISSGAGTIGIVGKGATDAGSGQHGVAFLNGATVQSTTGAITIQGRGGDGTGTGAQGIVIATGSVSTQTGNVTLTGWGGANSANANGISLDNASSIAATTGGALSLTGTGANGGYGLTATGTPSINAGTGALSFTSNNGIDFGFVTIAGSGGATFTGGTGSIAANNAGNQLSGTVLLSTAAGNASVLTAAGYSLDLGASSVSGDLNVTSGGALTQSGTLTVGGNSAFVAGSATLDLATNGTNNSFGGTVTLTNAGGANVLVASTGGLNLGAVTTTGDLTATANAGALTLGQANSYAAGKNVSLTATGALGTITISADQTLSNGNFTAVGSAGVDINASVDTGGGNVTIWGNSPGGVANGVTAGSFFGVNIDGAGAHIDAGGGNISIVGAGGTADYMHGVSIRNGAHVQTSGSGTLAITGRGGTGTGGGTTGVEFYAGGAFAQTQDGALTVTGTGGAGGGDGNPGVALATGQIRATGTGSVTVTGTGGAGGSVGIHVAGGGATVISAVDGNMVLIGTGGAGDDLSGTFGGLHSWGVNLGINADVKTTGVGNLSVTANGGTDGVSDYRIGMVMQQTALLRTTGPGAVNIVANGGTGGGGNNIGFNIRDSASVSSALAGTVSITGTGGGGSGTANTGVLVEASINAPGTADITVDGTGGYGSKGVIVTGTIQSANGDVAVTGIGGATGALNDAWGIRIESGGSIVSTGAGNITLDGTGGATSASGNVGVFVYGGLVQTAAGDITVIADGGGSSGSTGTNHGLAMQLGGQITSTSGDINITADGSTGGGSGSSNYGVTLDGSTTLIQAGSGNITISGNGGTATGGSNTGIQIATGAIVSASAGDLTVTGNGGGGNSTGVLFNGGGGTGGLLSSGAGNVTVDGTGGGSDAGITAIGTNSIVGGGSASGTVYLNADSINLGSSLAIQTTGEVNFNTQTAGLSLGINNSGSALNLTSAAIANVSASMIVLGEVSATGTITVGTDSANNFTTGIGLQNGGGSNPINFVGALTTTGDLEVSAGGAITQTGALTVGGDSVLYAGGNVTLANAANAMSGPISFTATGGNVTLANSGATSFGVSNTSGTLSVSVTGGTVSQTGAISTGGALTLTSDAAIAWSNAGNAFGGPLNITTTAGASANVRNSAATSLDAIAVAGDLTVVSGSTLAQGGSPLTVGGTSTFSSVGATTLADMANSFGGAVSLTTTSGGAATIAATGQLILGTSTIAGNFLASVGSPMSQTGALAVSGTAGFTAFNGPLTLTNTSNTFGGAVTLTNTGNFAVGIAASGALTLGNVSMTGGSTGGFTATASNGIAQSGGTTIAAGAGPTVLAGGSGAVVLGEAGNSFGSTVSLSGTGGTLAGFVNGQSGAAAAPFVTATGGIFSVNGTSVGSTPVVPPTTGTQAVLNEIASVAPIDSATRVETPQTGSTGIAGPAFESTGSVSTGDLTGGSGDTQSGGTSNEETGSTNLAGNQPAPGTGGSQAPTPPTGSAGIAGGPPAPTIVVSGDAAGGGSTPNDVRSGPAPQPGPVTLVPGVLTSVPGTPAASDSGTPGISSPFPQQGNSANW